MKEMKDATEKPAKTNMAKDVQIAIEIRKLRYDLTTMATVLDSLIVRDKLLRKIILRMAPIAAGKEVPAHVRDLLIEAGMVTGEVKHDDEG